MIHIIYIFQEYILDYYTKAGFKKAQLNVGIPLYGQTFQLSNPAASHGMNAASVGPGIPGEITQQQGMLSYAEICRKGNVFHFQMHLIVFNQLGFCNLV